MGIGKRIKEARNALNMTQEELAKILGVTKGAVANYENETSHPKEPVMYKMFDALQVDANYLFQDVVNIPSKVNDVTFAEYDHIKKYRNLDDPGRSHVDAVLQWEADRMENISTLSMEISDLKSRSASIKEYPSLVRDPDADYLKPQAAHARTDIEVTDEMIQNDDDIMNDENF